MTQVMLIDPSYAPAFVELERMYKIVERWQDFIDIVNSHIGILSNPADHVELYRDLGVVYRDKLQDAYHAIESFQAIIGIVPSDVAALYALADLYEHCEDYISAIDYLGRVIDCISDMREAVAVHFRIGTIYDKKIGSRSECRRALQNLPRYRCVLYASYRCTRGDVSTP